MEVAVIGLGYVGCVTAVGLASMGHRVTAYDIDRERVERVTQGEAPVPEPGLERALWKAVDSGMLRARWEAVPEATELALICVGTPSAGDGAPDLSALLAAVAGAGRAMRKDRNPQVVAIRSTVLPNLMSEVLEPALHEAAGRRERVGLCANPEFLREGSALADFADPPFTLIGADDGFSAPMLTRIFGHLRAPLIVTTPGLAMMVKYTCNAFHAAKVSFANEIANLCHRAGLDGRQVMAIMARDTRLNLSPAYLAPGFAYGGSCLPKDLRALLAMGRAQALETPLLGAIERSNDWQFRHGLGLIMDSGGQRIAMLGVGFKTHSGDVRESPLLRLCQELRARAMAVRAYDPDLPETDCAHPGLPADGMIVEDLTTLLEWADVVVVGKRMALEPELMARLEGKRAVIDLADAGLPLAALPNCRGLCW
jgi:GDP-mannose 6-dehydrogenase